MGTRVHIDHVSQLRVDKHITLIMQFAQRTCMNVSPKSGIKGIYNAISKKKLNAVGKISYDALIGNTYSIVGFIPKTEQNVLFPGRGGGLVMQCPFPLFQKIGRALGSVHLNVYERGDY